MILEVSRKNLICRLNFTSNVSGNGWKVIIEMFINITWCIICNFTSDQKITLSGFISLLWVTTSLSPFQIFLAYVWDSYENDKNNSIIMCLFLLKEKSSEVLHESRGQTLRCCTNIKGKVPTNTELTMSQRFNLIKAQRVKRWEA